LFFFVFVFFCFFLSFATREQQQAHIKFVRYFIGQLDKWSFLHIFKLGHTIAMFMYIHVYPTFMYTMMILELLWNIQSISQCLYVMIPFEWLSYLNLLSIWLYAMVFKWLSYLNRQYPDVIIYDTRIVVLFKQSMLKCDIAQY
jgi:hypothetical protein